MKKFGVIAGTPVDTRMGAEYLQQAGFETVMRPCSETPEQQNAMQVLHPVELAQLVVRHCNEMAAEGAQGVFLYCNSLAGAIDLPFVRDNVPIKIVTPLDVYKGLAGKYRSLAVIAANCQSLAAIEHLVQSINPDCGVYGAGILPLVNAIESGLPPEEIMRKLGLSGLMDSLCKMGGEALLLGCTHYPYLKPQLEAVCALPIIDPADTMLEMLLE